MKFVALVYLEDQKLRAVPDSECMDCGNGFRAAGKLVAAEALQPITTAKTLRIRQGAVRVVDGPFAETKELLAGFWIWQVRSFDEAVEWLKRAPFDGGTEIELRPIFEMEDFGEAMTPELREQEERLRAESAKRAG